MSAIKRSQWGIFSVFVLQMVKVTLQAKHLKLVLNESCPESHSVSSNRGFIFVFIDYGYEQNSYSSEP